MRLDELILRPLLIHNYKRNKSQLQKHFFELYEDDGVEIENLFNEAKKFGNEDNDANAAAMVKKLSTSNLRRKNTLVKTEVASDARTFID